MEKLTVRPGDPVYETYADAARGWGVEPESLARSARLTPEQVTPQMIAAMLPDGTVNPDGSISYTSIEDTSLEFGDLLLSAFASAIVGGGLGGGFQTMGVTGAVPGGGGSVFSTLGNALGLNSAPAIPSGAGEFIRTGADIGEMIGPGGATTVDPVTALNSAPAGSLTMGVSDSAPFLGGLLGPAAAAAGVAGAAGAAGSASGAGAAGAAAAGTAAIGAGNGGIDDGALSQILNEGNSGTSTGLLSGLASALGMTPDALTKALGAGLAGVLGAYASGVQGDELRELANQQMAAEQARYDDLVKRDAERFQTLLGREDEAIARQRADIEFGRTITEPSRERYEASYAPTFTMANDPGFMDALNSAGKASMYGMSVQGNPSGNPNAWVQSQKDVYDKVAYPALKDYRTLNATTGGLSSFGSAGATVPGIGTTLPGSTSTGSTSQNSQTGFSTLSGAAQSDANVWNSLGAATNSIFNPPKSTAEQLVELKRLMGT